LLVDRGLAETRTKAQALILSGAVLLEGKPYLKSGHRIPVEANIELKSKSLYVSRGGEKLAGALDDFQISPKGHVCVDIGSSTGGFTDCLLQRGAVKVFAIDVGTHQLSDKLRADPRVIVMEERHVLEVRPEELSPQPDFGVVDVSFIPLDRVLPKIKELISKKAELVVLVKPQFEVGPKFLKKGVVRSEEKQKEAVANVRLFAQGIGFIVKAESPSRLKGPKGNQEYFLHLTLT
jgi:23S rRNA (cytidine1920-2'-O)/16S rRNA (cytidine1409-2'-O)-methyltransferase